MPAREPDTAPGAARGAEPDAAHDDRDTAPQPDQLSDAQDALGIRDVTDPRAIRALAHPVRLAVIEALRLHGPLTATKAAELLGDSPGNMSWHLQTLAKYGFVVEAGGGRGRARPWKLATVGTRFSRDENAGPDAERAIGALVELHAEREFQRLREWEAQRLSYPPAWRKVDFHNSTVTYLTADEMSELNEQLIALVDGYRERMVDPATRPEDAEPVAVVSFGHPLPRPQPDGEDQDQDQD